MLEIHYMVCLHFLRRPVKERKQLNIMFFYGIKVAEKVDKEKQKKKELIKTVEGRPVYYLWNVRWGNRFLFCLITVNQ